MSPQTTIIRLLILQILVLILAVAAVGQAPVLAGEAVKVDSFGPRHSDELTGVMDDFLIGINKREKGARGIIVNYGTARDIERRNRFLQNQIHWRNFDASLITFVRGGNVSPVRTDFWIVPAGAKPPRIEPEAFVAAEFGRVTKSQAQAAMSKFFAELESVPDHEGIIILYGTDAQMIMQENWFTRHPYFQLSRPHGPRMTVVHGRNRKNGIGAMLWIRPPGASVPKP